MPVVTISAELEPDRDRLGGKAASLVAMHRLGIPVPPAFTITTDECRRHQELGVIPPDVLDALPHAVAGLQEAAGGRFGQELLVSVRSGAPTSMPGMMDTVLNLGIGADTDIGEAAFTEDVRRRFAEQYREVVGQDAPADPWDQLHGAIEAVFASWGSPRARSYRDQQGLSHDGGTAVTVQAMVYGNADPASGTGVLFTRDPLTGASEPLGEWLAGGQGEDVVSGRHDPEPLGALAAAHPELHEELLAHATTLECEHGDVRDVEFTVQSGRLWLLQDRAAKRSAAAAVRIAVAMAREGLIDEVTALGRVTAAQVERLLGEHLDPADRAAATEVARGRPAAPGLVTGVVVTDVDEAEDRALDGEDVVLARVTTNPDDVHAMGVVKAILTEVGGSTSHAAVVSRELGTACVVGCGRNTVMALAGRTVTVDADEGVVLDGALAITEAGQDEDPDLVALRDWAREQAGEPDGTLVTLLLARAAAASAV